jgi:hypothetical protein
VAKLEKQIDKQTTPHRRKQIPENLSKPPGATDRKIAAGEFDEEVAARGGGSAYRLGKS